MPPQIATTSGTGDFPCLPVSFEPWSLAASFGQISQEGLEAVGLASMISCTLPEAFSNEVAEMVITTPRLMTMVPLPLSIIMAVCLALQSCRNVIVEVVSVGQAKKHETHC